MRYEYARKPHKCPVCGSKRIVKILYGYPSWEVKEDVEAGRIALGGCVITGDDPYWKCVDCHTSFYLKIKVK